MSNINSKKTQVSGLKEKLDKALSAVLIDGRGLSVEQDTILRKELRDAGVDYKVYKNTIMRFAFEDTKFSDLAAHLKGPSTLALSYDDPTLAARIIAKHLKAMKVLEFKAGYVEGKVYEDEKMKAIGNIPSQEILLSKLLGSFKSPMAAFARLISAISEDKSAETQEA